MSNSELQTDLLNIFLKYRCGVCDWGLATHTNTIIVGLVSPSWPPKKDKIFFSFFIPSSDLKGLSNVHSWCPNLLGGDHTLKFHFVTIKHVVMFFQLQFSFQQLVFIFKIVKTLVSVSQSYPAIWKSCVWILLIYNQLVLPSPLPFHLEKVSKKIHQRTLILWDFFD